MGLFDSFNPFDPAGLMGGGGPMGGGGGEGEQGSGGGGTTVAGNDPFNDKTEAFDPKAAYGFGSPGADSKFNAMRKQQMGMGGSSQGG